MNRNPVTENDLHAYVDGELGAVRHAEVEAQLAIDTDAAERVRAYRAQKETLRKLFDPVLGEPLPESLRALAVAPAGAVGRGRPRLPRWSLRRVAASVFIAVAGSAVGWLAHDRIQPPGAMAQVVPLARQAAVAHAVFTPDVRRPVEVGADQEDQLVTWLSKRLGTPVRPPKLAAQGYELVGGRLLPGNSGPVAQFMYQDASGQRMTLYVSTEVPGNRDTAFRFAQEGQVNVFYWVDGKFGYALSAAISKNQLAKIATVVYEQLDGG